MKARVFGFILLLLVPAVPGGAQQTVDYASISGRVTDPSGAVIAGARVTARHLQTNAARSSFTDGEGRFRFPYLRVGPYELSIEQDGFRDYSRTLTLNAGSAFDLAVTLTVAAVEASVTVTEDSTVVEAARSQVASTIAEKEIRRLPMNGRSFLDLALLTPGVAPANIPSTQIFPETSAVPGVSLSVGGQRNVSNSFVVDGLSANDDAAGLSGMTYGVDAIEQLQVVTSGAQAELGRALGGYISVVTKSGTNSLNGTGYGYFRGDAFNARNALSHGTLPMDQEQLGGSLGGPLVRNRTFYFTNVEVRNLDQSGLVTIADSAVRAINARLAAVAYPGALIETGLYGNPVDTTNLLAKLDHQVSGRAQFTFRYSLYTADAGNARGAGGLSAATASSTLDSVDHAVAIGHTLTLTSRTVLETRAQLVYSDLKAPATDPTGPAVSIAGVAAFGTLSSSPTRRLNRQYHVVGNLSHQAGAHALRTGVDFLFNDDRITFPRAVRGSYTFASLASFLAGVYNNNGFSQTFGQSDVSQSSPGVGIYAQDEWKVGSDVTLNAGLRYDLQLLDTLTTDTDNVSPRVGATWSPFGSDRTIVRASAGLFYDRVPLRPLANAILSAGNSTDVANLRQTLVSLSPTQAGAPAFPAILTGVVPSLTPVNLTTMDPHLQNAHSRQASVELERQIAGGMTASIGYEYLRGEGLLMSVNQNVPTCVASGSNNGCRPNPAYANNSQYSSAGSSNYHGLHLSLLQRPGAWGYYRVSYTLSKSMNDVGEFFFSSPIDPTDLSKDWGRSDDDERHRLVVNAGVHTSMTPAATLWAHLTHGFEVSGTVQAYSAPPFNITSGVTTVQGTAGRPIVNGEFISRNAGVGSPFLSVNARVGRSFPLGKGVALEVLVEGFNLTNHTNVVTRNTNFGPGAYPTDPAPGFGRITAVGEPRAFQIGARVRF